MPKYNNRLNTGNCCNKPSDYKATTPLIPEDKPVQPEKPVVTVPTVTTGSKCWTVKIKHITKIGNKVLIMFDDCSFIEADDTVLDKSINPKCDKDTSQSKLDELQNSIKSLDNKVQSLEKDVVLKTELVEESHTSFDNTDVIIKALKYKE